MEVKTIKVKPWGKDQGDHVVINEADFDPTKHEPLDVAAKPGGKTDAEDGAKEPTAKELRAALDEKGISYAARASKAELQALLDAA
jgi:hypothetical protein